MNRKKLGVFIVVGLVVVFAIVMGVEKTLFHRDQNKISQLANISETSVKIGRVESKLIPMDIAVLAQVKAFQSIDLEAQESGYLTAVNVKNGELVQEGDVLFQINNKSQRAAVLSAKAALDQAKLHFGRIQTLVKEGAESQDELDSDQKNLQQAQGSFDQAQKALSETTVRAPFNGQVTYTDLSVGSYVNVGDKLIGVVNDQKRLIQYELPAGYLKLAAVGQDVFFTDPLSNASGQNQKKIIHAQVIYVSPEIDAQSDAFTVRALIQDAPKTLEPGLTLMATQVLDPHRQVLALPGLALLGDPNGFYVFIVNDKNRILTRRVTVGEQFNAWIEIKSGITPEDAVVVEGQQNIHEGQKVKVVS